jgi:hypothetical protein
VTGGVGCERLAGGFAVRGRGFAAGFGFALALPAAARPDAAVARRAVPEDFAALPRGAAAPAGRVDRDDLADADLEVPVVLDVRDLVVPEADLDDAADLVPVAGAAAAGLAVDIALAAAVSDFVAAVIALVAVFIACKAVDIVLAEVVAFVAAAVILVAAFVTLVAADETVRAALAAVGASLDAVDRVVPPAVALVRLDVLLADLVLGLLAVRRAAVRVVVRAGTDLPPSRSITESYSTARIDLHTRWATMGAASGEQWPQADRKQPLIPSSRATTTPGGGCLCTAAKLEASQDITLGSRAEEVSDGQPADSSRSRHDRYWRRPDRQPAWLRRDADHRLRDLEGTARSGAGEGSAAPRGRA